MWVAGAPATRLCPVRRLAGWAWALRLYRWRQAGHLPRAGGVLDQPARVMDVLEVIDDALNGGADNAP